MDKLFKLIAILNWNSVDSRATFLRTVRSANVEPKTINCQTVKKQLLLTGNGFKENNRFSQANVGVVNRRVYPQEKIGI
jgi:hypothetical protein